MNMEDKLMVAFQAGIKCNQEHPDDDSYDQIHFKRILDKISPQPSEQKAPEENFYCADWNRCGAICEEQCPACKKTNNLEAVKTAEEITWKYFGSTRTYSREKIIEAMHEFAKQSRQQTVNEALDCFESVFMIEPVPANILLIMEAFKQGFQKLETLKHNP